MVKLEFLSFVAAALTVTVLFLLLTFATGIDFEQMIEEVGPLTFAFFILVQVIVIVAVFSLILRKR